MDVGKCRDEEVTRAVEASHVYYGKVGIGKQKEDKQRREPVVTYRPHKIMPKSCRHRKQQSNKNVKIPR
jgi:hypothetical protein